MNFNILEKLNKKIIATMVVVGVLVVSLLVSTFAFDFFKKKEKHVEGKTNQKVTEAQRKKNLRESLKKLKDVKARHKKAIKKIKEIESELYIHAKPENEAFCAQLFEDFIENKVELILPIAHSDDFNDSEIQKELKPCIEKNPIMADKATEKLLLVGLTPAMKVIRDNDYTYWRDELASHVGKAQFAFRVHKVDFDNNPDNGLEYVIFSGGYLPSPIRTKTPYYSDKVAIFNVNKCDTIKKVHDEGFGSVLDYKTHKLKNNYSGLIKYKDKYYIYVIRDNSGDREKVSGISFKEWADKKFFKEFPTVYDFRLLWGKCGYNIYEY